MQKQTVDARNKELLTPIDVYSLELEPAYSTSVNTFNDDLSQDLTLLDTNVQKTGDLITLRYDETNWLEQPLASRSENVNPFNMVEFVGRIVMTPATDNWTRTVIIPGGERRQTGNTARTFTEDILISANQTHLCVQETFSSSWWSKTCFKILPIYGWNSRYRCYTKTY